LPPFFLFSKAVLDIIESHSTGFMHDRVLVLEEVVDARAIIYHFSDCYQGFMLHDWRFFFSLASFKEIGYSNVVNFVHLGEYEGYFMLEERTTRLEVLGFQRLAYRVTSFFSTKFPKGKHSSISIEQGLIYVVKQNIFEFFNVCVLLGLFDIVEWRCWIIR
jgi:hypothetical protein